MKPFTYILAVVIVSALMSCKKDMDRKLVGTYKGTARYTFGTATNPVRDKDTLYRDVIITIIEGTESTRKETKLTLAFAPISFGSYNENMPVQNGIIDFTRTNRGAAGTYYQWQGTIEADSLNLNYIVEQGNGTVVQWALKATKQ